MPIWLIILLGLVLMCLCIIAGYIYGASNQKVSEDKIIGQLLIDTEDETVYATFLSDPSGLKNNELVKMQVLIVASQQNQST